MKREQLTQERLQALEDLLVAEGVITEYEREKLRSVGEYGEAPELAKGLVERRK